MRTVEEREDEGCWSLLVGWVKWDSGDCEADEQGVSEMEGGHGGEFVGEAVIGPDRTFASGSVDCVYKSVYQ
jgi:hypothetical protein